MSKKEKELKKTDLISVYMLFLGYNLSTYRKRLRLSSLRTLYLWFCHRYKSLRASGLTEQEFTRTI